MILSNKAITDVPYVLTALLENINVQYVKSPYFIADVSIIRLLIIVAMLSLHHSTSLMRPSLCKALID